MSRLSHEAKAARTIAHDFNNLLFAISGHAQCLSELLPADGRLRLHIQEIADAARRGLATVEELRAVFPDRSALRTGPLASTERVLLVESEPSLRELMKDVLVRQGYEVRTAGDAAEAVTTCEHESDFHLLVADFTSHGMTGPELADVLRDRMPGLRVLFMSDGAEHPLMERARAEGAAFVARPLSAAALTRSVHQALDGCHAV